MPDVSPVLKTSDYSSVLKALGQNVRARRKARRLSQRELAEGAGLHRTYIADIERGARNASVVSLAKIARALNRTVSDLCRGIEAKEPKVSGIPSRRGNEALT